jgi:hypothetical protein
MSPGEQLKEQGFVRFPSAIDQEIILEVINEFENSYKIARQIQIKNGIDAVTDGTLHHLLAYRQTAYINFLNFLCGPEIFGFIKQFFNGNFILNGYGGVKNLRSKPSYVANIHRDIRFFSGDFPLMLNLLVMLDDFTLENGATYLLAGSHTKPDKPESETFYKNADRAIGKRGDVIFFNSNLWHAAGLNTTDDERRAITITFTKPFMKQQLDYPRTVGYEALEKMSYELQQMIGYFSRTPTNLDEWYQKPEKRFYRPGQD